MNYYNEIDLKAAAWIQELINEKLIPDGKIDTRSIVDVQPGDIAGFTQCHFFCGIAGWSRALRLAGWPDDREIWTGSCPCQPFSAAGKGEGIDDERHLWPYFYRLICARRPRVVIGEQVASSLVVGKAGGKTDSESPVWIDGVCADMEAARYAFGATDLPAAGIGAPHIRQRLYWVAYSELPNRRAEREIDGNAHGRNVSGRSSNTCRLADSDEPGRGSAQGITGHAEQCGEGCGMGDTESSLGSVSEREERGNMPEPGRASEALGMGEPIQSRLEGHSRDGDNGSQSGRLGAIETGSVAETGESSFWSDSTWHLCRDGKSRRIPAGSESVFFGLSHEFSENLDPVWIASHGFPLAPKVKGRAAILKGYGNAIVPELAAEFIKAVMQEIE